MVREWEDLGDGILYSEEFDPSPLRKSLGLDGGIAEKSLSVEERCRRASMLWRTGNLTLREVAGLGGWRVRNPGYSGDDKGGIVFDPPPSADIHLQR